MRVAFCQSLVSRADHRGFVFLSGDLGFRALEPLRDALGQRFINAGVAEQNMVSVAAGMARLGLRPWTYSIAPFMFARPFEQIRNDVCMHDLPVVLVGNGGGYGYGVMGGTHHALEDYGVLLTLPRMQILIPAFDADVPSIIERLFSTPHPAYLRLGLSEEPRGWEVPAFAGWRKLAWGRRTTIVAVGPLAGSLWQPCLNLEESERPNLWCVSALPLEDLPQTFLNDVRTSDLLCVVEEHAEHGGVGSALASRLLTMDFPPCRLLLRSAKGYVSGRYGSQKFHRRECGLDPESVLAAVARSGENQ